MPTFSFRRRQLHFPPRLTDPVLGASTDLRERPAVGRSGSCRWLWTFRAKMPDHGHIPPSTVTSRGEEVVAAA